MKMNTKNKKTRAWIGLLAIAALLAPGIAPAQQGARPYRGGDGPGFGMGPDDAIAIMGFEGSVGGKTVTGAPFTATFTTKQTQTLADGNQIQRSTTGTIARDSQGRTRRDVTLAGIGPWAASDKPAPHVIVINDVVASTQYILNPNTKIAHQVQPPRFGRHRGGREGAFEHRGPPPDDAEPDDAGPRRKDVVTTSLGTQTINGVQAEGTRYTRTIPAGAIGNQNPIVITTEKWYSPDLQIVVLRKHDDPRTGEVITQFTNIQRSEPDASLFAVPVGLHGEAGAAELRLSRGRPARAVAERTFSFFLIAPACGRSPPRSARKSPLLSVVCAVAYSFSAVSVYSAPSLCTLCLAGLLKSAQRSNDTTARAEQFS